MVWQPYFSIAELETDPPVSPRRVEDEIEDLELEEAEI
jgi:hypothetical protein